MCEREWQPEDIIRNQYKIEYILRGHSGCTYRVSHIDWEMPLRLKKIAPHAYPQNRLQYTWQRWIGMMAHPHIVSSYHYFCLHGDLYLLSEFIEGCNLETYLNSRGSNLASSLRILLQLAYALEYAHKNRLFHGNIHAGNILISPADVALLGDFIGSNGQTPVDNVAGDLESYGRLCRYVLCDLELHVPNALLQDNESVPKPLGQALWQLIDHPDTANFYTAIREIEDLHYQIAKNRHHRPIMPQRWHVESTHQHAFVHMEQKRHKHAEQLWAQASRSQPPSISALWNWHLFYLRQDAIPLEYFVKTLEEIQEMAPVQIVCAQAKLALELGVNIYTALANIQSIQTSLTNAVEVLQIEGELLYRICRYSEAAERFIELVKRDPEGDNWYRLAAACLAAGNTMQAYEMCQCGLNENPGHILLQLVANSSQYLLGNIEHSERMFVSLLQKYPDSLLLLIHAAEYYAGLGIYHRKVDASSKKLATKYFAKAIQYDPFSIKALRGYVACSQDPVPQPIDSHINLKCWSEIRKLDQHPNIVTAVAFSRDGNLAISGDCEGHLYLWAAQEQRLLTEFTGHEKHITNLALSLDGKTAVSGSWDQTARIWDTASGTCLATLEGHTDKINRVAMTPDAKWVATGSWDGNIKLWNGETQQLVTTFTPENSWITDIEITVDGQYIFSCDGDERIHLWEVASNVEIDCSMQGLRVRCGYNSGVAVSTGSNYIKLWQIPQGKLIKEIVTTRRELCIGVSDNAALVVTRNEDDIMSIWEAYRGSRLAALHAENVVCGDINANGHYLLVGNGNRVYLWENVMERPFPILRRARYLPPELRNGIQIPELISTMLDKAQQQWETANYRAACQHYATINTIPGYENNEEIALQMQENIRAQKIDPANLQEVCLINETPTTTAATSMALAANGEIALVAFDDDPIGVWNLRSGYMMHTLTGHRRCIAGVAISRCGSTATSISWDGSARLWQLDNLATHTLLSNHSNWGTCIAMNEKYAVYGTRNGEVVLADLVDGGVDTLQSIAKHSIAHVALAQMGKYAISSSQDGVICIWEVATGKCRKQIRPHERFATAIAIDDDGRFGISASRDGRIFLWNCESGDIVHQFSHSGVIRGLQIVSKDLFLTLSQSGLLDLWSIKTSEVIYTASVEEARINAWSLSSNLRFLATASEEKTIKLWELQWKYQFADE